MKRIVLTIAILTSCCFVWASDTGENVPASPDAKDKPVYYVIPIHGPIDGDTVAMFRIHMSKARAISPDAIVLDVDSPGGSVYAAETIIDEIIDSRMHFVAFIRRAMSAAAGISLTCSDIYMTDTATIGAATSYMMSGGKFVNMPDDVRAKFQSVWRAACRKAAMAGGHNPLLAEGMIDSDIQLLYKTLEDGKVEIFASDRSESGATMLKRSGTILCMTSREASDIKLANEIISGLDELGESLGMNDWRQSTRAFVASKRENLPRGFGYPDELTGKIMAKADQLGLNEKDLTDLARQSSSKELGKWLKTSRVVGDRVNWTITMLEASESESQRLLPVVSDYLERAKEYLLRAKKAASGKRIQRVSRNTYIERDIDGARDAARDMQQRVTELSRMRSRLLRQPVKVYGYSPHADNMIVSAWFTKRSLDELSRVKGGGEILVAGEVSYVRYGPCEAGEPFMSPDFVRPDEQLDETNVEKENWIIWVELENCRLIDTLDPIETKKR